MLWYSVEFFDCSLCSVLCFTNYPVTVYVSNVYVFVCNVMCKPSQFQTFNNPPLNWVTMIQWQNCVNMREILPTSLPKHHLLSLWFYTYINPIVFFKTEVDGYRARTYVLAVQLFKLQHRLHMQSPARSCLALLRLVTKLPVNKGSATLWRRCCGRLIAQIGLPL